MLEESEAEISSPVTTRKRKRSETPSAASVSSKSSEPVDSTPPQKKKRGSKRKAVSTSVSSVAANTSSPRSSRSPSNDSLGCNEQIPQEEEEEEEGIGDEGFGDDATCSATQCIRPMANEISWVQCDLCQLWFHLLCVGLTTESVERIDSYNCFSCRHKTRKAMAAVPSMTTHLAPPGKLPPTSASSLPTA